MMYSAGSELSFTGRESEIHQLHAVFDQYRNMVISGAAGVGKSALVTQAATGIPLFVCQNPASIDDLSEQYLVYLGVRAGVYSMRQRAKVVRLLIRQNGYAIGFDAMDETSIANFSSRFGKLIRDVPTWIITRSDPSATGALFGRTQEFAHLQLQPLKRNEVRVLIARAVSQKHLPSFAIQHIERIYRRTNGNPQILKELVRAISLQKSDAEAAFLKSLDLSEEALDKGSSTV